MTHVYSAGGSRQAAVFTAIIGLHVAVLLVVLNDPIVDFRTTHRDPGPINVKLPEPAPTVVERPENVVLAESFGQVVEKPDIPIPDFLPVDDVRDALTNGDEAGDGGLPSTTGTIVRAQASLKGQSRDFAAAVRACYPAGSRRNSEEGLLKLAVTIGAGGQAQSWRLVESTGFPNLDAAAPCVLGKLSFNAARENGSAIQSVVILPIAFRLD